MASDRILPNANYEFECEAKAAGNWRVLQFEMREVLSQPYECELELGHDGDETAMHGLLGTSCTFHILRGTLDRSVHGIIHKVAYLGVRDGVQVARVALVPALWALSQQVDTRIFQGSSANEIIKTVLEADLKPYNRSVRFDLRKEYPAREYCVQYRETDLDFVTRLMSEEGMSYYFDQSDKQEQLVIIDVNESAPQLVTVDGTAVPVAIHPEGLTVESVRKFVWQGALRSTSIVIRDFDWTQPMVDMTRKSNGKDVRQNDRQIYDSGPALTLGGYSARRYSKDDGQDQATRRREAEVARQLGGSGDSNVTGLSAGVVLELRAADPAELDQKYLVTQVSHRGAAADDTKRGTTARNDFVDFGNQFVCVPLKVPYRPERLPRPEISGPETAVVVGPSGEEVSTDEHGRINVQFHWDRQGKNNEHSSCWLRVAQSWAGAGFGSLFLPRIGMEVVVQFLEGNPDRPLVTGCLYNGKNPPPVTLPKDKTKSGLVTASSPGSVGHNELTFEDAKGSEEIQVTAEKDLDVLVKNDKSVHVKGDHTEKVDGIDLVTVLGMLRAVTVAGAYAETVGAAMTTLVGGAKLLGVIGASVEVIGAVKSETVVGSSSLTVLAGETRTITGEATETVVGPVTNMVTGDFSETITGDVENVITGNVGNSITGHVENEITGDVSSTVTGDITRNIKGAIDETITGNVTEKVTGDVEETITGDVEETITGAVEQTITKDLSITTTKGITLTVGSCKIAITPSGIEIDAPDITVKSSGPLVLKGTTTSIN